MHVTPEAFLAIASEVINSNGDLAAAVSMRTYIAHFRLDSTGTSDLWNKLQDYCVNDEVTLKNGDKLKLTDFGESHLLWTLFHLNVYPTNDVGSAFCNVTRHTYRKYTMGMIMFLNLLRKHLVCYIYVMITCYF